MKSKLQNEDEVLLQQALFQLCCRRGAFAPVPEFGSRLYLLPRQKPASRRAFAVNAAQEVLSPLGLCVCDAQISRGAEDIFYVKLTLENSDAILEVTV